MFNKWCCIESFENVKGPPIYAEACKWFLKLENMLADTSAKNGWDVGMLRRVSLSSVTLKCKIVI